MKHSLYLNEEKVVQQAEELCLDFGKRSGEVIGKFQGLIDAYRKSIREQQRLVRVSDRQQEQLRQLTQESQEKTLQLQEQAIYLQSLNRTLETEIEIKKQLEAELRHLATTDSLTGSFNRHRFYEIGQYEWLRMERNKKPLAVIMLDIDRFKDINDNFGHATGDEALRYFARLCREKLRAVDTLGRLGGDEFGVLLPETGLESAVEVGERIRNAVNAYNIAGVRGETVNITVSVGVAVSHVGEKLETLLARADAAMYMAKEGGRNRVESMEGENG
jgi:diguanylate cyclase (GGDEF)-like protein